MKIVTALLITVLSAALISFTSSSELEIGATMPKGDVKMMDVSGKSYSLNDLKMDNGLLVIFSCNTCPWVIKWNDRYNPVAEVAKKNKIGMVLVNSNENYRDRGDGMDDMQKFAEKSKYTMKYVLDKNHIVADAFGAAKTPHVFLFDKNGKLVYRGAIDDNAGDKNAVTKPWLKNALNAIGSGQEVSAKTSKSIGCTIKRTR